MANKLDDIKKNLVNNWILKVLALGLAIMSFRQIRKATSFEMPYEIPVEVEVEKGIAILDQNPAAATVTFRGSQNDLRLLDKKQLRAVIRAKGSDPAGSESVPIQAGDIKGAGGIRVASIDPDAVSVTFDREVEEMVAVSKPKIIGVPLIGRAEVDYEPRVISIRGPKRRVQETRFVTPEPIDVDGRVQSFNKRLRLLPPSDTWVSRMSPAEINVKVNIVTESVTRSRTNVAVLAVMKPGFITGVTFTPATVNVILEGRAEILDRIPENSVKITVDCEGLDTSANYDYELPVHVYFPPGLDVDARAEPDTVRAVFQKL